MPFLETPLPSLDAWVAHFAAQPIPVLAQSVQAIAQLAARDAEGDEGVDAQLIVKQVGQDPLMALRILAHLSDTVGRRRELEVETITEALVLLGTTPFFRAFSDLPALEQCLASRPEALEGARRVLDRGRRAAQFALGFCVQRMDDDAAQAYQAALLHDFAELLLWVHAPSLAETMARKQRHDPTLRSVQVQQDILGIELGILQQELMHHWRLPALLIRLNDDRHAEHPSVRSVHLGIRVARHSANGWDNPALPDDIRDVGTLLQLSDEHARHLLLELDS
jgi:HD-like signal output (HDOD) protein